MFSLKIKKCEAAEMTKHLRALTNLPEDQGSGQHLHQVAHNHLCFNYSFRESDTLTWPRETCTWYTYKHAGPPTHIQNFLKCKNKEIFIMSLFQSVSRIAQAWQVLSDSLPSCVSHTQSSLVFQLYLHYLISTLFYILPSRPFSGLITSHSRYQSLFPLKQANLCLTVLLHSNNKPS